MLRRRTDNKKFLLFGLVGFLVIALVLTSYFVFSERDFDERGFADGQEEEYRVLDAPVDYEHEGLDSVISLEPEMGTISMSNFKIDLIIDTHGEEVMGIDVGLEYSGDIEYVDFEQGNIQNCSVIDSYSENFLNLACFIDAAQQPYQGQGDIFASVIFKATDDGFAQVDVSSVVFAVSDERNELNFTGDLGEYTTVSEFLEPSPSCGSLHGEVFSYQTIFWPQGTFCAEGDSDPSSPSFPEAGSSTSWQCVNSSESVTCSAQREAAPPSCGNLDGQTFTYSATTWPSNSFCSEGNPDPSSPSFPEAGSSTNWNCVTQTDSVSCSASRYSTPTKDDGLPDTFIFDNTGILLGLALVLISGILLLYRDRGVKDSFSMRNKLCL